MEMSDELHVLLENDPSPLPQFSLEGGGGARWALEPFWILWRRTVSHPYQKSNVDTLLGLQFIS